MCDAHAPCTHAPRADAVTRRDALVGGATLALAVSLAAVRPARASSSAGRAPDYLASARRADHWLRAVARTDGTTRWWPPNPDGPGTMAGRNDALYSGSAGVVLFYLELHHATGEAAALDEARAGADALLAALPTDARSLDADGAGLYTGLAGILFTLAQVHARTGDPRYATGVQHAMTLLRAAAGARGDGSWNSSHDIVSGTAGIGLTMHWASARARDLGISTDAASVLARRAAQQLRGVGQPQAVGTKWEISPGFARRYPNFSHGTAGVAYFLAREAPRHGRGEEAVVLRDAAVAGARYLESIAVRTPSDGLRVMHSEPGGEQLFYMSWCHGPAGTARLFRQLGQLTNDRHWGMQVDALARAIVDSGAPEQHPDRSGFWNNVSQCCGNAGIAEFFVDRYRTFGGRSDLAFAQRVMDNVLERATAEGAGLKWVQAENRTSPEQVFAQTGLMQGAAGVGLALLHLDGALGRREPLIVLPDSPWE